MSKPEINPDSPEVQALQERINNASYAEKIIIALGAGHVTNGSSWGFDKDLADNGIKFEDVQAEVAHDQEASKVLVPLEIRQGGIVDIVSLDYALKTYHKMVGSNLVDAKMVANARAARDAAIAELIKFCQDGKQGVVGFYNTNRSSTITIKGQTAPSFRLNVKDFLGVLHQFGYSVRTAEGTVSTAEGAMRNIPAFMKQLSKAPSSNSVLVEISKR